MKKSQGRNSSQELNIGHGGTLLTSWLPHSYLSLISYIPRTTATTQSMWAQQDQSLIKKMPHKLA